MRPVLIAAAGMAVVLGGGLLTVAAIAGAPTSAQLAPGSVPAAYGSDIARYGSMCPPLSPPLLAAQLAQESGFDPTARSSAGAEGMAQFLPSTFATWGISADGTGPPDIWDPGDAIASMANYDCTLAHELAAVPGDPVENMLAGYNAGPYAVTTAGGVPDIAETRNYVRRIRALAAGYSTAGGNQTVPGSEAGQAALVFAYDLLGTPYRWGGTGTAATDGQFDCSGLTQAAYAATGITIPRTAAQQYWAGPHIPVSQLQPGDLVFYATNTSNPATIHHVGIYAGGGEMIDAPHTGVTIRFDPVNEAGLMGAMRPVR